MEPLPIFIEESRKKTFAGAFDWPGWCRSGKNAESALLTLYEYAARYGQLMKIAGIDFDPPQNVSDFLIRDQVEGNATTSFGAPAIILQADYLPAEEKDYQRWRKILGASWDSFDTSYQNALGKELRKGPRGGGRDAERILIHIIEADLAYLKRMAWSYRRDLDNDLLTDIQQIRQQILAILDTAENEELPEKGPRGGIIWPVRFFVRRVVWHTLDHQWEIDDRLIEP
jgi:hypothetical protein